MVCLLRMVMVAVVQMYSVYFFATGEWCVLYRALQTSGEVNSVYGRCWVTCVAYSDIMLCISKHCFTNEWCVNWFYQNLVCFTKI